MPNPLVIRKVIEDIPVYEFYKNNRQAVDQYLEIAFPYVREHIEQGQVNHPYCYVLDVSRSGMYPINYLLQRSRAFLSEFEFVPEHYIAYITDNSSDTVLVNMIDGLTARNMAHTRRIFLPDELDKAIEWLQGVMRDSE